MNVSEYLAKVEPARRGAMAAIHGLILETNPRVTPAMGKMMGKVMIVYNLGKFFVYGLASLKGHMTLHAMPMCCAPPLRAKYARLLPKAQFQVGCINFKKAEDAPLAVVRQLLAECAQVDMTWVMEKYLQRKKK
jgi:hypothetical protein